MFREGFIDMGIVEDVVLYDSLDKKEEREVVLILNKDSLDENGKLKHLNTKGGTNNG